MGLLDGVRYGQYHGWGGIVIPMIDLMKAIPQTDYSGGSGSRRSSSDDSGKFVPFEGLSGTVSDATMQYLAYDAEADYYRSMMSQGIEMRLNGQEKEGYALQQKGLIGMNNAEKGKLYVESQRGAMKRDAALFDQHKADFKDNQPAQAVKNGIPYHMYYASDPQSKTASEMMSESLNKSNSYVYEQIEENSIFAPINKPYSEPYYGANLFPDMATQGTDYMKTINSNWNSICDNMTTFGDKKPTVGNTYITSEKHSSNEMQILNFAQNADQWLNESEMTQVAQHAYRQFYNKGFSFIGLSSNHDDIMAKYGKVVLPVKIKSKGDDAGNGEKYPEDIYAYVVSSETVKYARNDNGEFIDKDGNVVADVYGKGVGDKKMTDAREINGEELINVIGYIPELYLTSKVYQQKGSYSKDLDLTTLIPRQNITINNGGDKETTVKQKLINYFTSLQMQDLTPANIEIAVDDSGMSQNFVGMGNFANTNYRKTLNTRRSMSTKPVDIFGDGTMYDFTNDFRGMWVVGSDGIAYGTTTKSPKSNAKWMSNMNFKPIDVTGEGIVLPQVMTNDQMADFVLTDPVSYLDAYSGKKRTISGPGGQPVEIGIYTDLFGVDVSNVDYQRDKRNFYKSGNTELFMLKKGQNISQTLDKIQNDYHLTSEERNKYQKILEYRIPNNAMGTPEGSNANAVGVIIDFHNYLQRNNINMPIEELNTLDKMITINLSLKGSYDNGNENRTYQYKGYVLSNAQGWNGFYDIRDKDYAEMFEDRSEGNSKKLWNSRNEFRMVSTGVYLRSSFEGVSANDAWKKVKDIPMSYKSGNGNTNETTLGELVSSNPKVQKEFIDNYGKMPLSEVIDLSIAASGKKLSNPFYSEKRYRSEMQPDKILTADQYKAFDNVIYMKAYVPIGLAEGSTFGKSTKDYTVSSSQKNDIMNSKNTAFFNNLFQVTYRP